MFDEREQNDGEQLDLIAEYGLDPAVNAKAVEESVSDSLKGQVAIGPQEMADIVSLGAIDHKLYSKTFFPGTVRDEFPDYSDKVWAAMEDPNHRMVNMQLFRGSGKTTDFRLFLSRRIAYGSTRCALCIGVSQAKGIQTLMWLKGQIERNTLWTQTFGLSKGKKWQDVMIEIYHEKLDHSIWVLAYGITGPVRGVNLDDYRPDIISLDDVVDDENAKTEDQREKISDLVFGAIKNSLAPEKEAPSGKLIIKQTPIDFGDVSTEALKDPSFHSIQQGCWTEETKDLPVEHQVSVWEDRFPTATLRIDKQGAIARNKLSVFSREMEVKLVTPESATFMPTWLNYYTEDQTPPLHKMAVAISIDPVPKPTKAQIEKGLKNKDFECHMAWGFYRGNYYLLEVRSSRGHTPDWSVTTFFEMRRRWRPLKLYVDSVAYQSTLSWLISEAMKKRGEHTVIEELVDKRAKPQKIEQGLSGPGSNGCLYVRAEHSTFIDQFLKYPNVEFDDELDAAAMCVENLGIVDLLDDEYYEELDDHTPIEHRTGAP